MKIYWNFDMNELEKQNIASVYEEISHHLAENEVFLSFNNDDVAQSFREWWYSGDGPEALIKWIGRG